MGMFFWLVLLQESMIILSKCITVRYWLNSGCLRTFLNPLLLTSFLTSGIIEKKIRGKTFAGDDRPTTHIHCKSQRYRLTVKRDSHLMTCFIRVKFSLIYVYPCMEMAMKGPAEKKKRFMLVSQLYKVNFQSCRFYFTPGNIA